MSPRGRFLCPTGTILAAELPFLESRNSLFCLARCPPANQRLPLADSLRQLRRAITEGAIRRAIEATASLPIGPQRSSVRRMVTLAGGIPMLRRKVRENMRLALGDMQLQAKAWPDAERSFRRDLAEHPHSGWALRGLTQALQAQGRQDEAAVQLAALDRSWIAADPALRKKP